VCVRVYALCVCVRKCVWLLFLFSVFCGWGCSWRVCLCFVILCLEVQCVFVFVLAFELTGCCAFFWLGFFVARLFVSAFSLRCIRWG